MLAIKWRSKTSDSGGTEESIHYKIAADRRELEAAFQLVYEKYLHRGLIEPNVHQMRISPYGLTLEANTLVAIDNGSVVSTQTLIEDGKRGLPVESLFQDEVQSIRNEGLRIAEVTCLAHGRSNRSVAERLMSLMVQFAVARGVDRMIIAVCPRHASFYQRIAFRPFGQVRSYPEVLGKPALPMQVDLSRLEIDHPNVHNRFFSRRFASHDLIPRQIPVMVRRHFEDVLKHIDSERSIPMAQIPGRQKSRMRSAESIVENWLSRSFETIPAALCSNSISAKTA